MEKIIDDFIVSNNDIWSEDIGLLKKISNEYMVSIFGRYNGEKCIKLLKKLMYNGFICDNALNEAINYDKHKYIIKLLVEEYKINVNYGMSITDNPDKIHYYSFTLYKLLQKNDFINAEYIIKYGANVNKELYIEDRIFGGIYIHGKTYLIIEMIEENNYNAVKFLLEHGADTDVTKDYCNKDSLKKYHYLTNNKIEIIVKKCTHIAIGIKNKKIIELLRKYKAF